MALKDSVTVIFQKRVMTTLRHSLYIFQDIGTNMMGLGCKIAKIMSQEAFGSKDYSRDRLLWPNAVHMYEYSCVLRVFPPKNIVFK